MWSILDRKPDNTMLDYISFHMGILKFGVILGLVSIKEKFPWKYLEMRFSGISFLIYWLIWKVSFHLISNNLYKYWYFNRSYTTFAPSGDLTGGVWPYLRAKWFFFHQDGSFGMIISWRPGNRNHVSLNNFKEFFNNSPFLSYKFFVFTTIILLKFS